MIIELNQDGLNSPSKYLLEHHKINVICGVGFIKKIRDIIGDDRFYQLINGDDTFKITSGKAGLIYCKDFIKKYENRNKSIINKDGFIEVTETDGASF